MLKNNLIRFIGFGAAILGMGVNLLSDWVNEKKMDEKIEEKVNEAMSRKDKEES